MQLERKTRKNFVRRKSKTLRVESSSEERLDSKTLSGKTCSFFSGLGFCKHYENGKEEIDKRKKHMTWEFRSLERPQVDIMSIPVK